MFTPEELQKRKLKTGFGYGKKEVDTFLKEFLEAYENLYKENIEYKDKISVLSDGLQYYKSIEKTLQKALVLAQRAADENHADALKRAETIEKEARIKANRIIHEARIELEEVHEKFNKLLREFEVYKTQIKSLTTAQVDLMNSDAFRVSAPDFEEFLHLEKELNIASETKITSEAENTSDKEEVSEKPLNAKNDSDNEEEADNSEEAVEITSLRTA